LVAEPNPYTERSGISLITNSSTPFGTTFFYHDFPGDTNTHTYAPGVKESGGTNYTWYVNRTVGSAGASGHENGVSFSIAWEIAQ
jgi:hypothetical protein